MQNEQLRQAQLEILETHNRYAELYDFAPTAYLSLDKQGNIIEANLVSSKMLGVPRGRLIQQVFSDFILKEDQDSYNTHLRTTLESGVAQYCELHLVAKSGACFWVSINSLLVENPNSECNLVRMVVSDISQQKKMQDEINSAAQHLKLYREQTPLAAIEWNIDFQIVDWNVAANKMFGYTLDEVKGQTYDFLLPQNTRVDSDQIWASLMMQNDAQTIVNQNFSKNGRVIWCEWHNSLLRDESNQVIGAASLVLDISLAEQARQELLHKENEQREMLNNMVEGMITINECTALFENR